LQLFFSLVNSTFNFIEASCKHRDTLREKETVEVVEALRNNEISTDRDLNQEINLKKLRDMHISSHYGVVVSLILMFSTVIDAVEDIVEDGIYFE